MSRMNTGLKIALWAGGLLLLTLIGAGIWGHRKGYTLAMRGGMAEAEGPLDEAISHFQQAYEKNPNAYMVAHDLACCYAQKNDKQNCFLWLRKALETDHGDAVRKSASKDKGFANVRNDAEFKSLIDGGPRSP